MTSSPQTHSFLCASVFNIAILAGCAKAFAKIDTSISFRLKSLIFASDIQDSYRIDTIKATKMRLNMNLLFLCVANSARSQIAEGLARDLFRDADIRSAGSNPGKLNPRAVAVMKEIGLDISSQYSKSMDDLTPKFIANIDYIITLCAEEICPTMVAPKATKLHWPFPDPATKESLPDEEAMKRFRETRDAIKRQLRKFKKEIAT